MLYRVLADVVLVIHLLFIVFVVVGGLLVLRWRWVAWLHLPAVAWGAAIEFRNGVCPLTPLEKFFRDRGGQATYEHGFIENYLLPIVYPAGMTREIQLGLGIGALVLNLAIYGICIRLLRSRRKRS